MPLIYAIILIIGLTVILTIGGLYGFGSEGAIILEIIIGIPLVLFALLPAYQYNGNVDIIDSKIYDTPVAYVTRYDGNIITLSKHTINNDSTNTTIKLVNVHLTCGLGLYADSTKKLKDISSYKPIRFSK